MSVQQLDLNEYEWAIKQARTAYGQGKKWVVYAGEQLEIAGIAKENISARLRRDLPELSADYITQICGHMGWTDKRFSPCDEQVAQSQPADSSSAQEDVIEQYDSTVCARENQPYIEHLQRKIEFLQNVQRRLQDRPFLTHLDRRQYDEYLFLADSVEEIARQAWDGRQIVPVATQFFLAQIIACSTIKHGAGEYVSKVKELFGLTSKQVTKTLRGIVRDIHYLYEPMNQMEALLDGFYGKPCEACGSWRVKWENGLCRCFACEHEYKAKAEKLFLARPNYCLEELVAAEPAAIKSS